jgi:DNA segregation ATPase FtsK/SpoIIIE, S-DNA-T family
MPSQKKLIKDIADHAWHLFEAGAIAKYWYDRAVEEVDKKFKVQEAEFEAQYTRTISEATYAYSRSMSQLNARLAKLGSAYEISETDWEKPEWRNFSSSRGSNIPRLIRVGNLIAQDRFTKLEMPALLPIIGSGNVVIKASGQGKEKARKAIQSIMLRLLGSLPPGKLRFVCIDPIGLGSTMAGFIKGLPESLTGGHAWFEQRTIEEKLTELERHMAFVKQKYLGVSFATMEEYNDKAGEVEEPYRILAISDFPARFTDSAAQQLISITTNGPGTGVYTVIMVDEDQLKMPYSFNLADLERTGSVLIAHQDESHWQDPDFQDCQLEFDNPPPAEQFEKIVKVVGDTVLLANDIRISFAHFVPREVDMWKGDTRAGLQVPVGYYGAKEMQAFVFDERLFSSALIIGKTGSGKSTLLHILINNLALTYSPEELELYLIDFKQVEFRDYALMGLPHAQVIAVKSEREFGMSVLRGLNIELQKRKDTFANITSLSEYRTKTGIKLPRILMIADEFQELFSSDDALAREAEMILDRLVRQGRAFGINIILASQTLAGQNTFSSATRNQIPVRVALQCADSESRMILSEDNDRAKYLERPGEAIYNSANGRLEGNRRFQIAWLNEDERKDYIRRVRSMADRLPKPFARKPIVFDGDASAEAENNAELMQFLNSTKWLPVVRGRSPVAWLGEPIEMKSHTVAPLKRQSRSNLLIVGQIEYEETTVALLTMAVLSLASQNSPEIAQFTLVNLLDMDAPWFDIPSTLRNSLPHGVSEINRQGVPIAIEEIVGKVTGRLANDEARKWPSHYLVIFSLQMARDLHRKEGYYGPADQSITLAEQLTKIVSEGPAVGVHTLLSCDTYSNLLRVFDRRTINEFGLRVVLQMSPDDSRSLIDSETANKLGVNRALLYDEDRSGKVEKFRPYGMPKIEWLIKQCKKLDKRPNSE